MKAREQLHGAPHAQRVHQRLRPPPLRCVQPPMNSPVRTSLGNFLNLPAFSVHSRMHVPESTHPCINMYLNLEPFRTRRAWRLNEQHVLIFVFACACTTYAAGTHDNLELAKTNLRKFHLILDMFKRRATSEKLLARVLGWKKTALNKCLPTYLPTHWPIRWLY